MSFDPIRAGFLLVGAIAGAMTLVTGIALGACVWAVVWQQNAPPGGMCEQVGTSIRELFLELLAAVLGLLAARRS